MNYPRIQSHEEAINTRNKKSRSSNSKAGSHHETEPVPFVGEEKVRGAGEAVD